MQQFGLPCPNGKDGMGAISADYFSGFRIKSGMTLKKALLITRYILLHT
jgi:hypothetical protein